VAEAKRYRHRFLTNKTKQMRQESNVYVLAFEHEGTAHSFPINPQDESEWTAVYSKSISFHVDYNEYEGNISVYEIVDGKTNMNKIIYQIPTNKIKNLKTN